MTGPADEHFDALDDAYMVARSAIEAVSSSGVDYVLGGGWAVYAHVPRLPSIDVDLFVAAGSGATVRAHLQDADLSVGPGARVELLDLDARIDVWGVVLPGSGVDPPYIVPAEVFDDRIERVALDIQGTRLDVPVPGRSALVATKAVALSNRDLAFQAHTQGRARMLLGPEVVPRVMERSESYYHLKAGKDLFDIGLLVSDAQAGQASAQLLHDLGLASALGERLTDLDERTVELAIDLAERVDARAAIDAGLDWITDF